MQRTKKMLLFLIMAVFLGVVTTANAAPPVLQTQYGNDGIEIDIVKCKVLKDVMTLVIVARHPGEGKGYVTIHIRDVYYIANNKKYHVLKDSEGSWISSNGGENLLGDLKKGQSRMHWFKFPAPPAEVNKIEIILDTILPFEDVEVQR